MSRYSKTHLQQLAQQVLNNLDSPSVQSGLALMSFTTGLSQQQVLAQVKQLAGGN